MPLIGLNLNFLSPHFLAEQFKAVRFQTEALVKNLSAEDQCVQSMPDASPSKWHLGHSTWFFETVVLQAHCPKYQVFNAQFAYLFNSYYETLGLRQPRPERGLLTRPALTEVLAYRAHVNQALLHWLTQPQLELGREASTLIALGLHHEQQHQELLVTDALHLFSCNPLLPKSALNVPAYRGVAPPKSEQQWIRFAQGMCEIGYSDAQDSGFCFDNEQPRHKRWLDAFEISDRLITCGEYVAFIEDGGYQNSSLWLSEGWTWIQRSASTAPCYWLAPGSPSNQQPVWCVFGVEGVAPLNQDLPVTHLNFFEADAFAQWAGARLPTEFEWECAFEHKAMQQMLGSAWQWTRSAYEPYPGFKPWSGAIREYNGKFMVGQQVLRGSSWATPQGHARKSYRNFFPPTASWQITGLRLARDGA